MVTPFSAASHQWLQSSQRDCLYVSLSHYLFDHHRGPITPSSQWGGLSFPYLLKRYNGDHFPSVPFILDLHLLFSIVYAVVAWWSLLVLTSMCTQLYLNKNLSQKNTLPTQRHGSSNEHYMISKSHEGFCVVMLVSRRLMLVTPQSAVLSCDQNMQRIVSYCG